MKWYETTTPRIAFIFSTFALLLALLGLPATRDAYIFIPLHVERIQELTDGSARFSREYYDQYWTLRLWIDEARDMPQANQGCATPISRGLFLCIDRYENLPQGRDYYGRLLNAGSVTFKQLSFSAEVFWTGQLDTVGNRSWTKVEITDLRPGSAKPFTFRSRADPGHAPLFHVCCFAGSMLMADGSEMPLH